MSVPRCQSTPKRLGPACALYHKHTRNRGVAIAGDTPSWIDDSPYPTTRSRADHVPQRIQAVENASFLSKFVPPASWEWASLELL